MTYVWLLLVVLILCGPSAAAQATVIAAAPTIIQTNDPPITNVPTPKAESTPPTTAAAPDVPSADGDQTMPLLVWCSFGALATGLILWRRWDRLDHAPLRPVRVEPLFAFAMIFGLFVMQFVGLYFAQLLYGIEITTNRSLTLDEQARLTMVVAFCQFLLIGVYAYLALKPHHAPSPVTTPGNTESPSPHTPMSRRRAACVGALAMLITWPILAALGILAALMLERITGKPLDPLAHDTLREMVHTDDRAAFIAMSLLVVVCTPIIEEVTYRGLLQDALGRLMRQRWASIILTSIFFAAMHISIASIHAVAVLFVFSLILGWSYERTGRLTAPIIMHLLFNAANLTIAVLAA